MHTRRFWSPGNRERKHPVPQSGPWIGDPVWLADVLRAEGVRLVEFPGWRDRGHGDFNATAASIAYGRPDLPGPLSQPHIARDVLRARG
jgi:hypothetical protein